MTIYAAGFRDTCNAVLLNTQQAVQGDWCDASFIRSMA